MAIKKGFQQTYFMHGWQTEFPGSHHIKIKKILLLAISEDFSHLHNVNIHILASGPNFLIHSRWLKLNLFLDLYFILFWPV